MTRLLSLLLLTPCTVFAFDSGSNGSYGPIELAVSEQRVLEVPEDGVFHATTVTLGAGAVLRFACNERNTPVTILATGDVTLGTGLGAALVDVSGAPATSSAGGAAGCGGFSGGAPREAGQDLGGEGRGPGGGAASNTDIGENGQYGAGLRAYGSAVLMPLIGGSGGGSGVISSNAFGGGGGGGAILIASNTQIFLNAADIRANGGSGASSAGGSGSGGAIRLVAPRVFGTSTFGDVCVSQTASPCGSNPAAPGRIRVDAGDRAGVNLDVPIGTPYTIGTLMQLSLPGNPLLEITDVAGTAIPANSGSVLVSLPGSAPSVQPISLRASGFSGTVPVRLVLTPVTGSKVVVDDSIVMDSQGVGTVTINASVPGNSSVSIDAWVR